MFGYSRCGDCGAFARRSGGGCAPCRKRSAARANLSNYNHQRQFSLSDDARTALAGNSEVGMVTPSTVAEMSSDGDDSVASSLVGESVYAEGLGLEEELSSDEGEGDHLYGPLVESVDSGSVSTVDSGERDVDDPFVASESETEVFDGVASVGSVDSCSSGSSGVAAGGVEFVRMEGVRPKVGVAKFPSLCEFSRVTPSGGHCFNCHRCRCEGFDGIAEYRVELVLVPICSINFLKRKWRIVQKEDCEGMQEVPLCVECHQVLEVKDLQSKLPVEPGWELVWPIYCWRFLSNRDLQEKYQSRLLSFLPKQWLGYWLKELHRLFPDTFACKGLVEDVACVVVDVSLNRQRMLSASKGLFLGEIKKTYDDLLVPVCLCPWGCSCYFKETGFVPFESVFERFFPEGRHIGVLKKGDREKLSAKMESCRQDFLSEDIAMHLYNPDWRVFPSVFFKPGHGPVFLTCEDHNGGTLERYLHLPKTDLTLPSRHAECLSPAVLRTRTLKTSMPKKYSNGYRLQKCTASYCGIDTALVSETRHFDYLSHLDDISEARSFYHRDDIKGLAAELVSKGDLSEGYYNNLKRRSELLYGSRRRNIACGATMVTLGDAIKLQKMISSSATRSVRSSAKSSVVFRPNWPSHLVAVHTNDGYGAKMCDVPLFGATSEGVAKLVAFWVISCVAVTVAEVWEGLDCSIHTSDCWQGFFLSFLARKVTRDSVSADKKRNPFFVSDKADNMKHGCLCDLFVSGSVSTFENLRSVLAVASGEDGVAVSSFDHIISKTFTVAETVKFVIVKPWPLKQNLPLSFSSCGVEFEARFIATGSGALVKAWRRYGGIFDCWWVTERGGVTIQKDMLDVSVGEEPICAVYVQVEKASACQYRRDYLKYIGGQNMAYCELHEVPLVTSPVARVRDGAKACCYTKNSGGVCGAVAAFDCPLPHCGVCICKPCQASLETLTYVAGAGVSDTSQSSCASQASSSLVVEAQEKGEAPNDYCYNSDGGGDEVDCGAFDHLHTGRDIPMFDVEQLTTERGEGVDSRDPVIPTTQVGAKPEVYSGGIDTMGTSVLLNKFGTILVRRDNRLQASRREQNLTERVVARSGGSCIPLVYLEGMLFPSIFWSHPHSSKGGLLGSIPTALFCQHATRKRFRVASLASHAKLRLKAVGTSAGCNPSYLSFLFDCLANGALEGQDTRVVLSRGFEESMGPAGMRMRNAEDDFYTDTIDNRQSCHNLCASEREKRFSLFLTFTCNQLLHFGTKAIKQYVDSAACLENYIRWRLEAFPGEPALTPREEEEVKFSFQEAARNLLVRNWMEVRLVLMRYLLKSPEQPVGEVERIFVRDEYQSETGNLSHLHMLVTLKEDYQTPRGRASLQRLIRGFVDSIVGLDEAEDLMEEGLLEDWKDYWNMKDQAGRILAHHCDSHRCMRKVGPGSSELVCRVPDPRKLSGDLCSFFERKYDIKHTAEALGLYEQLGFCQKQSANGGSFVPLVGFLDPKRILPPARLGEGNISPVVGRLFAATRSSMNAQICTAFGTSRYVVKYITKIDENNYVAFVVKQGEPNTYQTQLVQLHNTKIASSAINEKASLRKSRNKSRPKGRAVASTEMQQIMLGYPQVYTNVEYIKVPSLPVGDRSGVERKSPKEAYKEKLRAGEFGDSPPDLMEFCIPWLDLRRDAFFKQHTWRCFTASQATILVDQLDDPVTLDRVALFGIRPPELLPIDRMEWYFKFFAFEDLTKGAKQVYKKYMSFELTESSWIDGRGKRLLLRPNAIPLLEQVLPGIKERWEPRGFSAILDVLQLCCNSYKDLLAGTLTKGKTTQWLRMRNAFVDWKNKNKMLPVVVFSNVRPKNSTKFIVHLLLSIGHFETEGDLWCNLNAKDAMFKAELLAVENKEDISHDTCLRLLKLWMEDQCQYYPISSRMMDDYVCSAYSIIRGVLLDDCLPSNEMPPCLYTKLRQETTEKMQANRNARKVTVLKATLAGLHSAYKDSDHVLPTCDEVLQARLPFGQNLQVPPSPSQSAPSYAEQCKVYTACKTAIECYRTPTTVANRNLLIVGPPGAGKTHCMLNAILYCCCQGLECTTTAILAERALLLGGQHIHLLFKLRVRDSGFRVHRMAELAVVSLQKHPGQLNFLRCLDVLFMDEMGQLSAELLSVLDIVMRRIRNSDLFMGGLLIIGTLDQVQLRPIKELPFLLSPYVMTCFRMTRLEHYVRCGDCTDLQSMNELARFYTRDEVERENKAQEFVELVAEKCEFYDTWKDGRIDETVLRIFPKKCQVAEAVKSFLVAKKVEVLSQKGHYLSSRAEDTMVALESHGEWQEASSAVVNQLSRDCSEPKQVDFFVGAVYQFTFNCGKRFSTTQLAVLMDMPSREDLVAFKPVKVWAAPPGTKIANIQGRSKEGLMDIGWREVQVGVSRQITHTIWRQGVKGKRKQYGLKHHIASTVHSAIGHTMHKVATELTPRNGVWERAMVVVLISRVRRAKDIIFVGSKEDNLRALKDGILLRCQYDDFMNHVVDVLSGGTPCRRIAMATHYPFRPRDIRLPSDSSGCVYLLVSTKNGRSLYVGFTQNIALRLKQHNSGYGSNSTALPSLRPWALVAYATGFCGDRKAMSDFESDWQMANWRKHPSVEDSIALGVAITKWDRYSERFITVVDQHTTHDNTD